jgi:hypothetical protein
MLDLTEDLRDFVSDRKEIWLMPTDLVLIVLASLLVIPPRLAVETFISTVS